jgi:single-strand DNA-binding protein
MNKWLGTGRLTKDPELHMTATNVSVCNFSIAVDRKIKKDGQPTADFFNCIGFGKTGEFISKFFTKGKMIAIDGYLQTRNWEDKENKKHNVVEIIVDNVEFCGDKGNGEKPDVTEVKKETKKETKANINVTVDEETPSDSEDELPF